MKRIFTLSMVILIAISAFTQVPQKMSYQCVIRNASGVLVTNQNIGIRISVLQGTATGSVVYQETYNPNPQTNANGLVTVEIGSGVPISGTFSAINWTSGPYFLRTETDPTGGTIYTIVGISQLLSVPYAQYAKSSGNGFSGNYNDLSNKPLLAIVAISGNYNDLANKPTLFNGSWAAITGKPTTLAGYGITDGMNVSHAANGITSTLINNWNTAFSWGNHTGLYKSISYVPTWSEITGKPVGNNLGDMQYWNGTNWVILPVGSPGQFLQLSASKEPTWIGATYPSVTTGSISLITGNTASIMGNVTNDGGAQVDYRGICFSTNPLPSITDRVVSSGSGIGNYFCTLSGLVTNTTYYARAFATNNVGTSYGSIITFTTLSTPDILTVADIDGNVYKIVVIGNQYWMGENLKTKNFNDGTPIPLVTDMTNWTNLTTPGYCWYNNDEASYKSTYGALYNWYTVITGKLCPTGWHVPNKNDWDILETYLGGTTVAGGKMKEIGLSHWTPPNVGATDLVGFTGLPGGYAGGGFSSLGITGQFWSTTNYDELLYPDRAYNHILVNSYIQVLVHGDQKYHGFSVRCIQGEGRILPTISTTTISSITSSTAVSGGNVTSDGGATIIARGVCWYISSNPTIIHYTTANGTGTGSFTSSITGLTAGTKYYVRAYATNSEGTSYGNEVSFTTLSK